MPPQPAREIRAVAAGNGPSGWKLAPFCEVDKRRWRQDCRKERGFRATRVSPSTPHLFARFPVSRISGECDYKQHGAGWRLARRPGRSRPPVKGHASRAGGYAPRVPKAVRGHQVLNRLQHTPRAQSRHARVPFWESRRLGCVIRPARYGRPEDAGPTRPEVLAGISRNGRREQPRLLSRAQGDRSFAPGSGESKSGRSSQCVQRVALRHESPAPVSGRKHPAARPPGPPDLSLNSERSGESRSPHPPAVRPICNLSAGGLVLGRRHSLFPRTKREDQWTSPEQENPAFAGLF